MALVIKGQDADFTPAPPGLHQAVCVDVVDLGMVDGPFGEKRKLKLIWQLKGRNAKGERFQVRQSYTQSLHEKARLRHDLETWRGRPFSRDEIKAFDVETLLGANCQMQVAHRVSAQGRTYANPTAIVPIMKSRGLPTPTRSRRSCRPKRMGTWWLWTTTRAAPSSHALLSSRQRGRGDHSPGTGACDSLAWAGRVDQRT
jgi:hypothetical protein